LLSGKGVGSTEFGAVWFYLDEVVGYPVSIETGNFDRLELIVQHFDFSGWLL
jgi:hypothetical protein